MVKRIWQIGVLSLLATAMTAAPLRLAAQTTNAAPAEKKAPAKKAGEKKESSEKKPHSLPFTGTLAAVDNTAKTITVGKRVFQITSETKIYKGSKTPATLQDGVVGETVRGSYKKTDDGKLVASSVYFGAKEDAKPDQAPEKKKHDTTTDKK